MRNQNPRFDIKRFGRLGAAGVVALATSTVSWAQTCPLCYRAAVASRAGALQALRSGVLILMLPPVVMFGLVTLLAVRRRDRFNDTDGAEATPEPGTELKPSSEPILHSAMTEEDHAWS